MGLITDLIRDKVEGSRKEKYAKENAEYQTYSRVAFDNKSLAEGGPSDEERQYAMTQLGKRGGKDAKGALEKYSKIRTVLGGLAGGGGQKGAARGPLAAPVQNSDDPGAPGQSQAQPAAQAKGGPLAAPQFSPPPPAPTEAQINQSKDTAEQSAAQRKTSTEQTERERRAKLADEGNMKGASRIEFIESGKVSPSLEKPDALAQLRAAIKASDPEMTDEEAAKQAGDILKKQAENKGAAKEVNKKEIAMTYPGDTEQHAVYYDPRDPTKKFDSTTGKPIPEGAKAVDSKEIEAKIRAAGFSDAFKFAQAYKQAGYSDEEAQKLGGELAMQEAERRVSMIGAGNIHEAIGVNATGDSVAIPLKSSPVPNATPARGPVPGGAPAPPSAPPQQSPAAPVARAPRGALAPPTGNQGSAGGSRKLDAVSPSVARQAAQITIPLTEAAVQIFGDPKQPDLKPVASFADLADDPKARDRIGKAIQLTMDGLGEGIGEASIGAGAGPVHVSTGGFGEWIQQKLNVPGAIAGERAKNISKVLQDLTPREKEAYNATMAEMSTMAGLRTLSKASAALGSIRMIEREMPKIGINTNSSKDFYDQLQKVAGAVANAVNTPGLLPKVTANGKSVPMGITPEMYERLGGLAAEIEQKKKSTPSQKNKLQPPGTPKAPKVGDIEGGYKFKGGDAADQKNWEKVRAAA